MLQAIFKYPDKILGKLIQCCIYGTLVFRVSGRTTFHYAVSNQIETESL